MKTKLFTLLFALLSATGVFAKVHQIGVLYYDVYYSDGNYCAMVVAGYISDLPTTIVIPKFVTYENQSYRVVSIGSGAFRDCTGLTSVTIPNSVTSIGRSAFAGCTGLTSVTIPNSVTSIGSNAFSHCTGLTSVTWNAKQCDAFSDSDVPFYNCPKITAFTFGNEVESIPSYLCYKMDKLTSVTIPNSVTSIGSNAFDGCTGLTKTNYTGDIAGWCKIEFDDNPIDYSHNLYINDVEVQDLVIPNSVTSIGGRAFRYCTGLTSVTIPNSVTSIGSNAFAGCRGLTSVTWNAKQCDAFSSYYSYSPFYNCSEINAFTFGNEVESIPSYLCYKMDKLTSVTIPNSVTSIGSGAFRDCTGLTSVTIGNSVTSIGSNAFAGCTGLTSVTIGNSVTSIGSGAFRDCTGLTSVTIGNSVTSIGDRAFVGCRGLTSVTWNAKQCDVFSSYYSYSPFYNCSEINAFTFGNEVESIPSYLCYKMDKLTSVTIPNSVTSIGDSAFNECRGLTSVTIPNSVMSIGDRAFSHCTGLTSVAWNAKQCDAFSDSDVPFYYCPNITAFTFGNEVESIPPYLCYKMDKLTSVTIPNSVTSIGDSAFDGCTGLTSVTIGSSVTSIGSNVFDGCTGLTKTNYTGDIAGWCKIEFDDNPIDYSHNLYINDVEVQDLVIPNSVTSIGGRAFASCTGLTSVTIGNNVTSIGSNAFAGCRGLTSVTWNAKQCDVFSSYYSYSPFYNCSEINAFTFGNEVESIPSYLCYKMDKLTSVTIPNSVTSIGDSAFNECRGLTSVTIPNSVTSIGSGAFCCCTGLTSVTIGNSVTSIGSNAFAGCTGLTSITIPNSVTTIGSGTFRYCRGLTSVTIGNSVTSIGDRAFDGCTGLTSVTIGNSVTSIGSGAFRDCTGLTSVTIGNSVTSIGSGAFASCTGLTSVTIGNSVTTIGDYAFYNCTALLTMEVKATLPPMIQANTFRDVSTTVMLTIPCESQNYYKAAQYWNQFTNWQEAVLSFSAVTEDATKGKVSVTQKPTCDDPTAVIKAVPAGGYRFKEWSDGNTENPRTVWVDEEMDLVAYFAAEGDGVENIAVIEGVSIVGNRLCIAGHEEENMNLYSATGAQLYAGQVRDITLPNAGVYLVQIGNAVQKLIVP